MHGQILARPKLSPTPRVVTGSKFVFAHSHGRLKRKSKDPQNRADVRYLLPPSYSAPLSSPVFLELSSAGRERATRRTSRIFKFLGGVGTAVTVRKQYVLFAAPEVYPH